MGGVRARAGVGWSVGQRHGVGRDGVDRGRVG